MQWKGSRYSRVDQVKFGKTAFKKLQIFVFNKFYLVHLEYLDPNVPFNQMYLYPFAVLKINWFQVVMRNRNFLLCLGHIYMKNYLEFIFRFQISCCNNLKRNAEHVVTDNNKTFMRKQKCFNLHWIKEELLLKIFVD